MSSRLTIPISKFTRSFSTTPSIGRPSQLLSNASKAAAGAGRKTKPAVEEAVTPAAAANARNHSTTATAASTPHRPKAPRAKPIPFMQTFHHSAPKPFAPAVTTIDQAVLPDLWSWSPAADGQDAATAAAGEHAYAHEHIIRVPLLPDNASPPAGARQPEAPDAPLPPPEIAVVASGGPGQVPPEPLTEAEWMGVDGVELKFAHLLGREAEAEAHEYEMGQGMIRDLWKGMVGDVSGAAGSRSSSNSSSGGGKQGPAAAAAA